MMLYKVPGEKKIKIFKNGRSSVFTVADFSRLGK